MNILGKRIKSERERKGLSQIELAKLLNISNTTLSQYETGQRIPSDEIKIKLAEIFNCSVDYLLGLTNVRDPIETIAAHHDGEDWTEEELEEIERFKEFVRMKRQQKKTQE